MPFSLKDPFAASAEPGGTLMGDSRAARSLALEATPVPAIQQTLARKRKHITGFPRRTPHSWRDT